MLLLHRLLLALPVLVLAGCAATPIDMSDMADAYAQNIEEHERRVILLNILRAGHELPMGFTTIPTWTGSGNLRTSTGVGGQLFGQLLSNASLNASAEVGRSFNFSLSSLDNAQFTRAFLADLSMDHLHALASSSEHRPRLLYTLLLSDIRLNPDAETELHHANEAIPEDFERFQAQLSALLDAGLRTEVATLRSPVGPVLQREEAIAFLGRNANPSPDSLRIMNVGGGTGYQIMSVRTAARFCLVPHRMTQFAQARLGRGIACASSTGGLPASDELPAGGDALSLDVRSGRDVFRYLGRMARRQMHGAGGWVATVPEAAGAPAKPLLVIRTGRPPAGTQAIAATHYMGQDYHVPLEGSGHSAAVFDLLSVLLSTYKVPGSIPASPGILLN